MRRRFGIAFLVPAALALPTFVTANASAGIDACGNIDVRAEETCTVETSGGCTAKCTPISIEAACAGKLDVTCNGQCTGTAEATCTASCDVTACEAHCNADPPSFSCQGECEANLDADCTAQCSSDANQSQCVASCKATASSKCEGSCTGTKGSVDCQANCQAVCEGECTAKANFNCEIDCASSGYVQCETDMKGGCEAQCTKPEGALFCNGSYVDTNNNLQSCIDALKAELNITATGSASCSGNSCQAEGQAAASCAVAPAQTHSTGSIAGLGLLVGALAWMRKKKN
jgi:hypothetical protein